MGDLHDEPLDAFVERMYGLLPLYQQHMPPRIRHMLPYMIAGDWLRSYATLEGIGRALDGLSRRVTAGAPMRGRSGWWNGITRPTRASSSSSFPTCKRR